jgi:hypothetical protein
MQDRIDSPRSRNRVAAADLVESAAAFHLTANLYLTAQSQYGTSTSTTTTTAATKYCCRLLLAHLRQEVQLQSSIFGMALTLHLVGAGPTAVQLPERKMTESDICDL